MINYRQYDCTDVVNSIIKKLTMIDSSGSYDILSSFNKMYSILSDIKLLPNVNVEIYKSTDKELFKNLSITTPDFIIVDVLIEKSSDCHASSIVMGFVENNPPVTITYDMYPSVFEMLDMFDTLLT